MMHCEKVDMSFESIGKTDVSGPSIIIGFVHNQLANQVPEIESFRTLSD